MRTAKRQQSSTTEDAFFADDDTVDQASSATELAADDDTAPMTFPFHRVVLTFAVLLALGWFVAPLLDELRYHLSGTEIVDLGDATGLTDGRVPPLGAHVRVSGVLGNKAATLAGVFRPGSLRRGPVQLRQLLGSSLFVEFEQDALGDTYTAFTRVTVEGRVASLTPESEIAMVRDYFKRRLGLTLPLDARVVVVGEKPGTMWRYPAVFLGAALVGALSLFFLMRRLMAYQHARQVRRSAG